LASGHRRNRSGGESSGYAVSLGQRKSIEAIFAHPLEKVKLAILRALPLLLQSFNREIDVIKILDEGINIDGLS
jgi:hypothetical protein